jgi:hypothetical protein
MGFGEERWCGKINRRRQFVCHSPLLRCEPEKPNAIRPTVSGCSGSTQFSSSQVNGVLFVKNNRSERHLLSQNRPHPPRNLIPPKPRSGIAQDEAKRRDVDHGNISIHPGDRAHRSKRIGAAFN